MRKLLMLIGLVALAGCGSSAPGVVDDAKLKLWTAYNDNIYTAKCQPQQQDEWFIICKKETSKGIYWVQQLSENEYVLHAVNGTAKTHSARLGLPINDFYLNGNHPKAEQAWQELSKNI